MNLKTDVIFLQKDRFEIYSSTLMKVFEFLFVPEIVQDFDIRNSELFDNLISVFIDSNKIPPSELIIVLSDKACFVKDFVNPVQSQAVPAEDFKKEIDLFIQHVPFDEVSHITFPLSNGMRICATNEGMYKEITASFEKHGFQVNGVIPAMSYGNNLSEKTVMDVTMANFILQNNSSVKQSSFLIHKEPPVHEKLTIEEAKDIPEIEEEKPEGKNNKRMLTLVGVFIVLLIILIIVYASSIGQPAS